MTVSAFTPPGEKYATQEQFNHAVSRFIRLMVQGKLNNVLDVTLDANQAATTVTSPLIGVNTVAIAVPTTANAASVTAPYRDISSPVNGSMSLIHANDANADKTFKVILVG